MRGLLPLVLVVAVVAEGCGGAEKERRPVVVRRVVGAAEPARSPTLTQEPAGRVVTVGVGPDAVVADAEAREFAVAVRGPDRVVFVAAGKGKKRRTVMVPGGGAEPSVFAIGAEAMAIAPGSGAATPAAVVAGRTFVADPRSGGIAVLDGGRPTARIARAAPATAAPATALAAPATALAAADADHALAVVSGTARTLTLYDPRTLRRLAPAAPAGDGPAQVAAEEGLIYVTDTRAGAVLAFATHPSFRRVGRTALPGGPYAIAADPVHHRLWITLTATNRLVELTAAVTPRVLRRLPTVRQPDAVAVDPTGQTVAVAGRTAGVLQLIAAPAARAG